MGRILSLVLCVLAAAPSAAQTASDFAVDPGAREARASELAAQSESTRSAAWALAAGQGLPVQGQTPDGRDYELVAIEDGRAVYVITENLNAAISTAANLVRGVSPYNVTGRDLFIGLWDSGTARADHRELVGRVLRPDGAGAKDHSTHCAGTLAAAGVASSALGMVPDATLVSLDWGSDTAEMTLRAAAAPVHDGKLFLSSHSYGTLAGWDTGDWSGTNGPHWFGGPAREDGSFGRYDSKARSWDQLCYDAPYFLPFKSAGNDRSNQPPAAGATYWYQAIDGLDIWTSATYDPATVPYADGYKSGYDTVPTYSTAKNIVTVGAVNDAVAGGVRSLPVGMASFSGWGPTDDGRVKPDLVANGIGLYSSLAGSVSSYGNYSGTSMSTPNAAGSAALLVDYYRSLSGGSAMRASTLKGLLIHTADDLGNTGPDYAYGWGLVDTKAAADQLRAHFLIAGSVRVVEGMLLPTAPVLEWTLQWDGLQPIRATICWTDPAASSTSGTNVTTPRLINDLDLTLTGPDQVVHRPWVLDPGNPSAPATTGNNVLDNVEQVDFGLSSPSGLYTLRITYKGTLTGGEQYVSLLTTGLRPAVVSTPTPTFTPTPTPTPNLPPQWATPPALLLPGTVGLQAQLLQLQNYVADDHTANESLVFEVVSQTRPDLVNVTVDVHGVLGAQVLIQGTGASEVEVSARDDAGETSGIILHVMIQGPTAVPSIRWKDYR